MLAPMLDHDAPVPHTVDQFLDMSTLVEQVDVPKIVSQDFIPQRAAVGGTAGGRAGALLPRVLVRGGHGAGTAPGHRWLRMAPVRWTRQDRELLVAGRCTTHSVPPPEGAHRPAQGGT